MFCLLLFFTVSKPHRTLAKVVLPTGRYAYTIFLCEKALVLDSDLIEPYVVMAKARIRLNQFGKARENFNKAIELNPRFVLAYSDRGIIWKEKREYDKAIADFTKAIELNPRFVQAYGGRGFA